MVRILIIKLKYALLNFREMSETPKVNILKVLLFIGYKKNISDIVYNCMITSII